MRTKPFTRVVWGVDLHRDGGLLFTGWHRGLRPEATYPGEPARPLLFPTRAAARGWCAERHAQYSTYPPGHACRTWRFRAVRVRETLEIIDVD